MGHIQIEIDDETKRRFQIKTINEDKTMRDKLLELINTYLKDKK